MYSIILKAVTLLLFAVSALHSAGTGTNSSNGNYSECAPVVQNTREHALWKCPALPKFPKDEKYTVKLIDVDLYNGLYSCMYLDSSGKRIQECNFKSKAYINGINAAREKIMGNAGSGNQKNIVSKIDSGRQLSFRKDFNPLNVPMALSDEKEMGAVTKEINRIVGRFKQLRDISTGAGGELAKAEKSLEDIDNITYEHLVKPHLKGTSRGDLVQKDNNFALFLAGLITLNPDIVEGYNESSGKLKVKDAWMAKAKTVSAPEKELAKSTFDSIADSVKKGVHTLEGWGIKLINSLFVGNIMSSPISTAEYDVESAQQYARNISSYADIFEMKLWGYFYNINRRMDIAYNKIAIQLLIIVVVWFALTKGSGFGVRYMLEKKIVGEHQTHSVAMNTMASLLIFGSFFVSFSTPISSTNTVTSEADVQREMRMNNTIVKYIIRLAAEKGSEIATTMSDLALDATLNFIVKKQNVYSTTQIRNSFKSDILPLLYYAPSLDIVHKCSAYYNMGEDAMLSTHVTNGLDVSINEGYAKVSPFFKNNNINGISFGLCHRMLVNVASASRDVIYAASEADEMIDDADAIMAKSVSFLVKNNVMLQDRIGWINTFSIPMTYFMMKEYDMFLSKGIDSDKVKEKADEFAKSLSLATSSNITADDAGHEKSRIGKFLDWIRGTTRTVSDNAQDGSAKILSYVGKYMLFNALPGFSSVREGIYDYLKTLYGDVLKVQTSNSDKIKGDTGKSIAKAIMNVGGRFLSIVPAGLAGKFKSMLSKGDGNLSPVLWGTIIMVASFIIAYFIWKMSFVMLFITSISTLILLKIVLYYKDLMVHFLVSPFMVVWTFVTSNTGASKVSTFMKDTVVLMMFPSMIVFSSFTFIFIHELFDVLYMWIVEVMLKNQEANLSLMNYANSDTDGFSAYFTLYIMGEFMQMLIYLFSFYLAYAIIIQLPEKIIKKLGLQDSTTVNITQTSEKLAQDSRKHTTGMA